MAAAHTLLADQLHLGAGSAEQAGEPSLEAALVAGLSSALVTLVCGHILLQVRVLLGQLQRFAVFNPLIP